MRISDWSSDVCSSDLAAAAGGRPHVDAGEAERGRLAQGRHRKLHRLVPGGSIGGDFLARELPRHVLKGTLLVVQLEGHWRERPVQSSTGGGDDRGPPRAVNRSAENQSELQSLMRTSYAVLCLKKKTKNE